MNLGAKGVALNGDIEEAEAELGTTFDLCGKHDHAHACAPDWHSVAGALDDVLVEPNHLHEEGYGRALSAGDDQSFDLVKFLGGADFENLVGGFSGAGEGVDVFFKIALDGQDSDFV